MLTLISPRQPGTLQIIARWPEASKFTIALVICVPISSASGSSSVTTSLLDPSTCNGGHCYCRWCQLVGAPAFDEPWPPLILGQRLASALAAATAAPQSELLRHPQGETWSALVLPQFHNRSSDFDFRARMCDRSIPQSLFLVPTCARMVLLI